MDNLESFGVLPAENEAERRTKAQVSEADVLALRDFAATLQKPGIALDSAGQDVTVPASQARAMLEAKSE